MLEQQDFQCAKLKELAAQAGGSSRRLRKLERMLNALHERNKPWFYPFAIFLMFGTQLLMAIEAWRIRYGSSLRVFLDAWAEFEALNSLANYAYENPDNIFPEFSTNSS